jgi:hypothetical protein
MDVPLEILSLHVSLVCLLVDVLLVEDAYRSVGERAMGPIIGAAGLVARRAHHLRQDGLDLLPMTGPNRVLDDYGEHGTGAQNGPLTAGRAAGCCCSTRSKDSQRVGR